MCNVQEKESNLRNKIKSLEDSRHELIQRKLELADKVVQYKQLFRKTGLDIYFNVALDISAQIEDTDQKLNTVNEQLLCIYKELNRLEKNHYQRDVDFFYGCAMYDILDRLDRNGSLNGIMF